MDLSDGTVASKLQVVLPADRMSPEVSHGAAVRVVGSFVPSAHKGQQFEMQAENVTVLGPCDVEQYPFAPRKSYAPEYTRSYLHLRPRQAKEAAMLRLRSTALMAVHTAFQSQGFFHVHTPILTSNDCEGGGDVFSVKPAKPAAPGEESSFFGRPVFLTVSAQMHLEAVAMSLSRVYTMGPTFRAENCNTRRHVCEFCMVEAEEAFVSSLDTLLQRAEDVVRAVFRSLVSTCQQDVAAVAPPGHVEAVRDALDRPFARMTYTECIDTLQSAKGERSSGVQSIQWGQDLGAEHEEFLVRHCGGGPLFVTRFPRTLKPFYMKEQHPGTVEGFDLLAPFGGELCGGSLREDDPAVLEERMQEALGDAAGPFSWYLDLRKYGSAPHGGFGLGFDRMLQYFLAVKNIRDVVPFPRWSKHCSM